MYFVCLAATTVAMIDSEACGDQAVSSDELSLGAWANARQILIASGATDRDRTNRDRLSFANYYVGLVGQRGDIRN